MKKCELVNKSCKNYTYLIKLFSLWVHLLPLQTWKYSEDWITNNLVVGIGDFSSKREETQTDGEGTRGPKQIALLGVD